MWLWSTTQHRFAFERRENCLSWTYCIFWTLCLPNITSLEGFRVGLLLLLCWLFPCTWNLATINLNQYTNCQTHMIAQISIIGISLIVDIILSAHCKRIHYAVKHRSFPVSCLPSSLWCELDTMRKLLGDRKPGLSVRGAPLSSVDLCEVTEKERDRANDVMCVCVWAGGVMWLVLWSGWYWGKIGL